MYYLSMTILAQINLEGFEEAAQQGTLFAILVSMVLVLFAILIYFFRILEDKNTELSTLRDGFIEDGKVIRVGDLSKEETRNKQWLESEKETLTVLKGVTSVLEMSEKMNENDTQKILEKLKAIEKLIEKCVNK